MTAQPVAHDGSTGFWSRDFNGKPFTQQFPDGRTVAATRGGGYWRLWHRVDWIEKVPLPGRGWGWLAAGAVVGLALGVASRRREVPP